MRERERHDRERSSGSKRMTEKEDETQREMECGRERRVT